MFRGRTSQITLPTVLLSHLNIFSFSSCSRCQPFSSLHSNMSSDISTLSHNLASTKVAEPINNSNHHGNNHSTSSSSSSSSAAASAKFPKQPKQPKPSKPSTNSSKSVSKSSKTPQPTVFVSLESISPLFDPRASQGHLKFIDIGANLLDGMYAGNYHGSNKHGNDLFTSVLPRAFNFPPPTPNKQTAEEKGTEQECVDYITHVYNQCGCNDKIVLTCGSLQEAKDGKEICDQWYQMQLQEEEKKVSPDRSAAPPAQPPRRLFSTVGIHPTRAKEWYHNGHKEKQAIYAKELFSLLPSESTPFTTVSCYGEFGLDYDRLFFSNKQEQLAACEMQLQHLSTLFESWVEARKKTTASSSVSTHIPHPLPLFLHDRNTNGDLLALLKKYPSSLLGGGVVHSFTGTLAEAEEYLALGLYIGINGCSLKTAENVAVVQAVPLDMILVETDAPWCEVKPTHAAFTHVHTLRNNKASTLLNNNTNGNSNSNSNGCAYTELNGHRILLTSDVLYNSTKVEAHDPKKQVKSRNEPCNIIQVVEILAALKQMDVFEVAQITYMNTLKLFFPDEYQSKVKETQSQQS